MCITVLMYWAVANYKKLTHIYDSYSCVCIERYSVQ